MKADARMRRALVELWQDHQAEWPVGAPERRSLTVHASKVRDFANMRGGKALGCEAVQDAGRRAFRRGDTALEDGLRFWYGNGHFTVQEGA